MMNQEEQAAIRALLQGNTPKSLAAKLNASDNLLLHEEEDAKLHPLSKLTLSDEDWGALRAHMLDGGGVRNDRLMLGEGPSLRDQFKTALMTNDRQRFLHLMPHIFKSLLKREGDVRPLAGGGLSMSHGGPARVVPKEGEK
jgi:hypothetical protein